MNNTKWTKSGEITTLDGLVFPVYRWIVMPTWFIARYPKDLSTHTYGDKPWFLLNANYGLPGENSQIANAFGPDVQCPHEFGHSYNFQTDETFPMSVRCDYNGDLNQCYEHPPRVAHSRNDFNGTGVEGVVVYYICTLDEQIEFNSTCQTDGQWTQVQGSCPAPTECPEHPPIVEYARDNYNGRNAIGTEVTYRCQHVDITYNSVCGTDGEWSPVRGKCPQYPILKPGKTFKPKKKSPCIFVESPGWSEGIDYMPGMLAW